MSQIPTSKKIRSRPTLQGLSPPPTLEEIIGEALGYNNVTLAQAQAAHMCEYHKSDDPKIKNACSFAEDLAKVSNDRLDVLVDMVRRYDRHGKREVF
jgi:hypothetical protein